MDAADGYEEDRNFEEPEFLRSEELKIEKNNKKKDLTNLLDKVDQYRRDKALNDEDIHKEIKLFKNPNSLTADV